MNSLFFHHWHTIRSAHFCFDQVHHTQFWLKVWHVWLSWEFRGELLVLVHVTCHVKCHPDILEDPIHCSWISTIGPWMPNTDVLGQIRGARPEGEVFAGQGCVRIVSQFGECCKQSTFCVEFPLNTNHFFQWLLLPPPKKLPSKVSYVSIMG